MKTLLTGSNGFLVANLLRSFDTNLIIDKLSRSNSNYNIDLSSTIPDFKSSYDLIVHAAGKTHFSTTSKNDYNSYFDNNVTGTINLIKGLEQLDVLPERFVFISSVAVYGKSTGFNISENQQLLANDPYGLSKIEAEKVILAWCNKHNVICTILRLPLVVGDDPPGSLREMIKGISEGYYFNIGFGKARKSMVLAEDVAAFILKASEIGGIYNLTDGYHPSFNELSKYIAEKFGKERLPNLPLWLARLFALTGDIIGKKSPFNSRKLKQLTSTLTFDDSKARTTFGWNPTPVLKGFILSTDKFIKSK
jgi:nucleoside-diphosphate-sugar epimerase